MGYFKIPDKFRLAGREWTVERVGKKRRYGQADMTKCVIRLSARCKDEEEYQHTFLHELMHVIAYAMGWSKFYTNEMRVDGVASLLLQAILTGE